MKILAVTSRSVTVELEGEGTYCAPSPYKIYLNGKQIKENDRNVFSLFSLTPSTGYVIEANGESAAFKTDSESVLINVKDFNAYGDGKHDDTGAFCAAIAVAPEGATVFIPEGDYYIKPIFLKSDITLWLHKKAALIAAEDRSDYPVLPALIKGEQTELNLGTWQGEEAPCFASIITGYNVKNVKIIGEGQIDCNALAGDWYKNHRVMRAAWRPRGLFFNRCKNVLLQGVAVHDTPSWNVHPYFCENVKLYNLRLKNIPDMPTTDGIDADCCNGVDIAGVDISVGDDCISLKSGTLGFAKKYRAPCKNVTIHNCLMRDGHGGVVFGSELSGGIQNVAVTKCVFDGTDRGLRIKTRRGRGRVGVTDNVSFDNIIMKGVKVPFSVNMYYNMGDETGHTEYVWSMEKQPVDERTPYIGDFTFSNMICENVAYSAGAFYGLPEAPISGITLNNVTFTYDKTAEAGYPDMMEKPRKVKNQGLDFHFVKSVTLKNVQINGCDGEPILLQGVDDLKIIQ